MGDYSWFAEYAKDFVDAKILNKAFQQNPEFEDQPSLMDEIIKESMMQKWEENLDTTKFKDGGVTVTNNFRSFVEQQIMTQDKLVFVGPKTKEVVNFEPVFYVKNDLMEQAGLDPGYNKIPGNVRNLMKLIIKKSKKQLEEELDERDRRIARGEPPKVIKKETKRSKQDLFEATQTTIEKVGNQRKKHVLSFLKTELRGEALKQSKQQPTKLTSFQIAALLEQIKQKEMPLEKRFLPIGIKNNDYLLKVLEKKGVDVTKLSPQTDTTKIRALSKKEGINLRQYKIEGKDELIVAIQQFSPRIKSSVLEGFSEADLKKKLDQVKKITRSSTRTERGWSTDLPTEPTKIKEMYKEKGLIYSEKTYNTVLDQIKDQYSYLSSDTQSDMANQVMATKGSKTPVIDNEIIKKFLRWKGKDPNKVITRPEIRDFVGTTNREFKRYLNKFDYDPTGIVGPLLPGQKQPKTKQSISLDEFRSTKNKYAKQLVRYDQISEAKKIDEVYFAPVPTQTIYEVKEPIIQTTKLGKPKQTKIVSEVLPEQVSVVAPPQKTVFGGKKITRPRTTTITEGTTISFRN